MNGEEERDRKVRVQIENLFIECNEPKKTHDSRQHFPITLTHSCQQLHTVDWTPFLQNLNEWWKRNEECTWERERERERERKREYHRIYAPGKERLREFTQIQLQQSSESVDLLFFQDIWVDVTMHSWDELHEEIHGRKWWQNLCWTERGGSGRAVNCPPNGRFPPFPFHWMNGQAKSANNRMLHVKSNRRINSSTVTLRIYGTHPPSWFNTYNPTALSVEDAPMSYTIATCSMGLPKTMWFASFRSRNRSHHNRHSSTCLPKNEISVVFSLYQIEIDEMRKPKELWKKIYFWIDINECDRSDSSLISFLDTNISKQPKINYPTKILMDFPLNRVQFWDQMSFRLPKKRQTFPSNGFIRRISSMSVNIKRCLKKIIKQ